MNKQVYVVTAYRWGDRENHSYVVGIYDDAKVAIRVAETERAYRGGKYICEVLIADINKSVRDDFNPLLPLEDHPDMPTKAQQLISKYQYKQ